MENNHTPFFYWYCKHVCPGDAVDVGYDRTSFASVVIHTRNQTEQHVPIIGFGELSGQFVIGNLDMNILHDKFLSMKLFGQ